MDRVAGALHLGNSSEGVGAHRSTLASATLAIHASVSLGLDAAKQMKPELAVLAVCRLTAPFTRSYYFSDMATVSNPYASQYRTNYVMTELLEVWIYDRKSGVIHTKITARH